MINTAQATGDDLQVETSNTAKQLISRDVIWASVQPVIIIGALQRPEHCLP